MRKLSVPRGGGEKLGVLAFEVAALMSRAASLWRALGDAPLARLRGEAIRLEGVRRLVSDDDAALLSLALAETAAACGSLARAVSGLSARCADPLLRRFDSLFAALVDAGARADRHGLRYAAEKKMDRKARKMQRLVAFTAHLCHELDVLAELEQGAKLRRGRHGAQQKQRSAAAAAVSDEAARRVARQRQAVERLREASLWNRTFDYAVRLLARSLFTIVARIIDVFDLEPATASFVSLDSSSSSKVVLRNSWSASFVGNSTHSTVYPSDVTTAAADTTAHRRMTMLRAKSGKPAAITGGDARRFLMSRSKSLKEQLKWPGAAGKHLIGCVVAGGKSSPVRERWIRGGGDGDLPLSFSYAASNDDYYYSSSINSFQSQPDRHHHHHPNAKLSTSVFLSSRDLLTNPPETSLGAAALALHYANLIIFVEKLAVSPHHICSDEREELYAMLTARLRASLRARLLPFAKSSTAAACDPILAAEWADTVRGILGWLAPLAHNMVRWQAERNFEQRNVASSGSVLLLQTLHFADQEKTEATVTELLVGLNYLWKYGREMEARQGLN
ncbi:hypothetical protein EJB05_29533, partial [Eragrostis curvula]